MLKTKPRPPNPEDPPVGPLQPAQPDPFPTLLDHKSKAFDSVSLETIKILFL